MRRYNISITYEIVSYESAALGDFEETGFIIESGQWTAQEIADHLKREYYVYWCNGGGTNGGWFATYPDADFRTGDSTTNNFHINSPMPARVLSAIKSYAQIKGGK